MMEEKDVSQSAKCITSLSLVKAHIGMLDKCNMAIATTT
jgi:hypothetical protein